MNEVIHAITPGDHFSARTGSAIPTVVDGLAKAADSDTESHWDHYVALDASTYRPRYDSATPLEYVGVPGPSMSERYLDLIRGRVGRSRHAVARYYSPMTDAIVDHPPAVVLAHNAPILPWLLRNSQHRVVLYAHNDLLRTYSKAEAGRTLAAVSAIVCVSDSLAEQMRRELPRELAIRVHTVANGVDCEQFAPASSDGVPVANAPSRRVPLRVMFVGRMVPEKGPDVLIRAAAILGRDDLEFVFVGSQGFDRHAAPSVFEKRLRRLAAGRVPRIRFEPFVDRSALPALLHSAAILVVPSRWAEPSGLTAGEGMASGLPIVASRIGGIPEVVGPAGRYVPPGDPAALASVIADLADDVELRRRMAADSRARARSHDWAWAWSNLRRLLDAL